MIGLANYRPLDGFQVPFEIATYPPDTSRSPWAFTDTAKLQLWLRAGSLRPTLTPKEFEPPTK